jgi:ABC-2 type transport system ATP-binding protein
MTFIIQLKHVNKTFKIPHEKRQTLKEHFIHFHKKIYYKKFYALKDINLQIKKGDFLGVIGRNGSGKSTLLKILANIYTPTGGEVIVNGNVSPFLELGIGFNGDLTARENVYLNGVILGLSRKEIDSCYSDIVNFAELSDFMEMKLKNFSSGMQVRLAFAVAIQAKADIYLCDEVLAVGDLSFQKKCLNIFDKLKQEGKTIVYVSHDLESVERFCTKTILLENGKIADFGDTKKVVEKYKKFI